MSFFLAEAECRVPVSAANRTGIDAEGLLHVVRFPHHTPHGALLGERHRSQQIRPGECVRGHMFTRLQLTLLLPQAASLAIEEARLVLDPVQHSLIAAHVTLCREDEFDNAPELLARLRGLPLQELELVFGPAESFNGHGLLLPCIGGAADYQSLRALVLGSPEVRAASAHITLAHPRNPRAPGNCMDAAHRLPSPLRIRFDTLSLIEQTDRSAWRTLWSLPLRTP
jgi:hypothetical protein